VRYPYPALALCLPFVIASAAVSQEPSTLGCALEKGYYQCNRTAFMAALKEAKTVSVESRPFDQATTNSLGKLARSLNKTEVSGSADLTFVVIRTQAEGIYFGPSDRELASFLVYSRGTQESERRLIWIETFDGEPNLVWPIVVYNIIKQFRTHLQ
jgi:hypothetical protein